LAMEISNTLGEYMLKGWVLTDNVCPTSGCNVPLMRSPAAQTPTVNFCANCDAPSSVNVSKTPLSSALSESTSHYSRSSTPPTEISEIPSSPDFTLPPESAETARRREQLDLASAKIGKKLLQGWAILSDECPNLSCFGVPLVRPPGLGGEKDPRKLCVICGNTYKTEIDTFGQQTLRLENAPSAASPSSSPMCYSKPSAQGNTEKVPANQSPTIRAPVPPRPLPPPRLQAPEPLTTVAPQHPTTSMLSAAESSYAELEETRHALQRTLQSLNRRLDSLSSSHVIHPDSVALAADAVTKVVQALSQVRQQQWYECQVITSGY